MVHRYENQQLTQDEGYSEDPLSQISGTTPSEFPWLADLSTEDRARESTWASVVAHLLLVAGCATPNLP